MSVIKKTKTISKSKSKSRSNSRKHFNKSSKCRSKTKKMRGGVRGVRQKSYKLPSVNSPQKTPQTHFKPFVTPVINSIQSLNVADSMKSFRNPGNIQDPNLGVQPRQRRTYINSGQIRTESGDFFTPSLPRGQDSEFRVQPTTSYDPYQK
jgi:hypothetical protein